MDAVILSLIQIGEWKGSCMAKKAPHSEIPDYEIEALARSLFPEIQKYFESEQGKKEFAEWKAKRRIKTSDNGHT